MSAMTHQIILHLDGARLFNALVAKKEFPGKIMDPFFIASPFVLTKVSVAPPVVCSSATRNLFVRREGFVRYSEEACGRQDFWQQPLCMHWIIMLKDLPSITHMRK